MRWDQPRGMGRMAPVTRARSTISRLPDPTKSPNWGSVRPGSGPVNDSGSTSTGTRPTSSGFRPKCRGHTRRTRPRRPRGAAGRFQRNSLRQARPPRDSSPCWRHRRHTPQEQPSEVRALARPKHDHIGPLRPRGIEDGRSRLAVPDDRCRGDPFGGSASDDLAGGAVAPLPPAVKVIVPQPRQITGRNHAQDQQDGPLVGGQVDRLVYGADRRCPKVQCQ